MAKIAPPTIASVLASKSVAAPTASVAKSTTTPAPSMATGSTIGSIGYYTGQWMSLADAQAARKNFIATQSWTPSSGDTISYTYSWPLPDEPTAQVAKWSALYNAQWQRTDFSGRVIPNSPNATVWSNKNVVSGVKTNAPVIRDANINRVQVWKLVSNFKDALSTSKWDKSSYRNSINYDSLSPYDKEVADRLFNLTPVKPPAVVKPVVGTAPNIATNWYTDDSPFRWGPSGKVVSVVWYTDNPDWTTTNKLSDWTTSIIRYTKNPDWSLTPKEVTDRTGLRAPTGVLPDNSVKAIRAANPWMTVADARAQSLKQRLNPILPPSTIHPTEETNGDIYDAQLNKLNKLTEDAVTEFKRQQQEFLDAGKTQKDAQEEYIRTQTDDITNEFNTFQNEQNKLVSDFEGNRLNQVQGDLRQVLLSRWVDVSKVTPEQLIALSGTVWTWAFKDISSAKERATSAIEQARQNKLSKMDALRQKKMISDSDYTQSVANINAQANTSINNVKLKTAETIFWVKIAGIADTRAQDNVNLQNTVNILKSAGFTNSSMTPEVLKIFQNSTNVGDAFSKLNAYIIGNPELAKTLDKNLKSSGSGWSLSDQIALMNYQLNTQKFAQDTVESNITQRQKEYERQLESIKSLTNANAAEKDAMIIKLNNSFWTVSPTPSSGGA